MANCPALMERLWQKTLLSFDIDGVVLKGPPPKEVLFNAARGRKITAARPPARARLRQSRHIAPLEAVSKWFHKRRRLKEDAGIVFFAMHEHPTDEFRVIALSGRPIGYHEITEQRLARELDEDSQIAFESIFLNSTNLSSAEFKPFFTREMLKTGFRRIIHFEDDLHAALSVAAVDEGRVFVYLVDNLATRPWVRARTGNEVLPDNVKLVRDLNEAYQDLQVRFLERVSV